MNEGVVDSNPAVTKLRVSQEPALFGTSGFIKELDIVKSPAWAAYSFIRLKWAYLEIKFFD